MATRRTVPRKGPRRRRGETPEPLRRPQAAGEKPTGMPPQDAGGEETARQGQAVSETWDEGAPAAPVRRPENGDDEDAERDDDGGEGRRRRR